MQFDGGTKFKNAEELQMKNVIVVTDFSLSENGEGISQTLYNLFSSYEPSSVVNLVNKEAIKRFTPTGIFESNNISYKSVFLPHFRNRVGMLINKYATNINSLLTLFFLNLRLRSISRKFRPAIIFICPNGVLGVEVGLLLIKRLKLPSVVYFMDDWMAIAGNQKIEQKINALLSLSAKQIFISEALRRLFLNRYTSLKEDYLIAHNPVKIHSHLNEGYQYIIPEHHFKIIYAGSIWPMHFDSLHKFALALSSINRARPGKRIELLIYTREGFWHTYKSFLEKLDGVIYKGYVEYKDLQPKLQEANALLVTSSFLKGWEGHSMGSVQTKLTDYMVALRPIISIGPEWGACNQFVKTHNCGYVISDDDVSSIEYHIDKIIHTDFTTSIRNSFIAINELFDSSKVQTKFYQFLNA